MLCGLALPLDLIGDLTQDELHMRLVEPNENDDGYAVLNEVFEAVAPVAFDHRHS